MQHKFSLLLVAVLILSYNSVYADDLEFSQEVDSGSGRMEKCRVVDQNGNGLIKPYMADSGNNLAGDAEAWILVPYGQCKKINSGNFSGVSKKIREKIQGSDIQQAQDLH